MQKFILVGTQRSGTTLLRTTLDSHPDILCLGEIFYLNKNKNTGSKMGKNLSDEFSSWKQYRYTAYLEQQTFLKRIQSYLTKWKVISEYFDYIFSLNGHKAIGFKLMHDQMKWMPGIVDYIKENNIKIIHIHRENTLEILASLLTMKKRGYAHKSKSSNSLDKVQIEMPVDKVEKKLDTIYQASMKWKSMFSSYKHYHLIKYEEYVADRDNQNKSMLDFIGVDSSEKLTSELQKVNTLSLKDVITNYDDIAERLKGTRYRLEN